MHQLDWTALAWRWRLRKAFWQACIRIARQRLVFDTTLWSYSLHHQDVDAIKTMLPGIPDLTSAVGLYFASPLLRVDAEQQQFDSRYRHLEYKPLIASRAHQLNDRSIQNRELSAHWTQFLSYVSFRYSELSQWTTHHRLQLCYLLLLQERVDDALVHFRDVQRPAYNGSDESIHYDYLSAYLALYSDPGAALSIAKRYQQCAIAKKRKLFDAIEETLAEMTIKRRDIDPSGQASTPYLAQKEDADTRDREMEALAATEPSVDFTITAEGVAVTYTNVRQLTLSVHVMDLEPLFSSKPFLNTEGAESSSSSFLYLVPNFEQRVDLPPAPPAATARHVLPLPSHLKRSNLLVSLRAGSVLVTRPHYAHGLAVSVMEAYGQLKVTRRASDEALPRVYVKVYAMEKGGGAVSFYRDGYTDWRGRFDYASLSTDRLPKVAEFAILIHSEEEGAVVKQAHPPGKSAA